MRATSTPTVGQKTDEEEEEEDVEDEEDKNKTKINIVHNKSRSLHPRANFYCININATDRESNQSAK